MTSTTCKNLNYVLSYLYLKNEDALRFVGLILEVGKDEIDTQEARNDFLPRHVILIGYALVSSHLRLQVAVDFVFVAISSSAALPCGFL